MQGLNAVHLAPKRVTAIRNLASLEALKRSCAAMPPRRTLRARFKQFVRLDRTEKAWAAALSD